MSNRNVPRMTRAHFELVADLLFELGDLLDLDADQRRHAAKLGADTLAPTNGNFSRSTFEARAIVGPRPWAVVEATPGYLPDAEPASFETRRQAESYAAELASELRAEGYRVTGSARAGTLYAERAADDLGRVVEVVDLAVTL